MSEKTKPEIIRGTFVPSYEGQGPGKRFNGYVFKLNQPAICKATGSGHNITGVNDQVRTVDPNACCIDCKAAVRLDGFGR